MKKVIMFGSTGAGKTTLCQRLHGQAISYRKTQMIENFEQVIDTPGECVENRVLFRMLMVSSVEADVIAFVQDCTKQESYFPPGFATAFAKPVIGIVSKVDLAASDKEVEIAKGFLAQAGASEMFCVSFSSDTGFKELQAYLEG